MYRILAALAATAFLLACVQTDMYSADESALNNTKGNVSTMNPQFDLSVPSSGNHFASLTFNSVVETQSDSLSTFGVDVDRGSFTYSRGQLRSEFLPEPASVRVEEFINAQKQAYPPTVNADRPLGIHIDAAQSPFRENKVLVRIGIQSLAATAIQRKPWNLTFLVDISGSMTDRLVMVQKTLVTLLNAMHEDDRISITTYAGGVSTRLHPTQVKDKAKAMKVIAELHAGGSTAMASGIENAYQVNLEGFLPEGENRVIICSDGDANVGLTDHAAILKRIQEFVDQGIMLSTLGFGVGNYNDVMMEQLADKGNGNYSYIDSQEEIAHLFGDGGLTLLQTVAEDVKVQVAFHSEAVAKYRLLGYENRDIADDQFTNPHQDGGEVGPDHVVTALYEVELTSRANTSPWFDVRLRWKKPMGSTESELSGSFATEKIPAFTEASKRFRMTTLAGEFAELLRQSPFVVGNDLAHVQALMTAAATEGNAEDLELIDMVQRAKSLTPRYLPQAEPRAIP